jgi:tRNA threonylcarbamoyladenosine biosynthesis protein TsaE
VTLPHRPILGTLRLHWPDEAGCAAFAAQLARQEMLADALIELRGPLGAGKTTFVRHLLRALGVTGRVRSPTFTVLETYEAVGPAGMRYAISHLDLYRFDDPHEWLDAGLRDVFEQPGLKLVEWPEKAGGTLPPPDLAIRLEPNDDASRDVTVEARSERGRRLIA